MKKILLTLAATGLLAAAGAARAGDVQWSIGINFPAVGAVVSSAPPVVYAPPQVVYAPAPVVYAPPRVVYVPPPVVVRPVPVVYAPAYPYSKKKWRHGKHGRWHDDD